jgi:hypothetical protein
MNIPEHDLPPAEGLQQQPSIESSAEIDPQTASPPPVQEKSAESGGRLYIVVQDKSLLLTSDAKLASNAKQINKFVKNNLNTLNERQLKLLKSISLQDNSYTKSSFLPAFVQKTLNKCDNLLMSVATFLLNRGRTDASLVKEVKQTAENRLKVVRAIKDLQGKLNHLDVSDSTTKLSALKKELSEVEMKLFDLTVANAPERKLDQIRAEQEKDTPEIQAFKEQKARLREGIEELKEKFTDEKKEAIKDFLAQTRQLKDDPAEIKAAKKEFSEKNNSVLSELKSLTSTSISNEAQINVAQSHKRTTFAVPTQLADRAMSHSEIKGKGYALRASDEMTVKKHVEEYYEAEGMQAPTSHTLGSAVGFDHLTNTKDVSYDQLHYAAFNKLIDHSVHKDDASYVAAELNDLVQELPKKIKTLEDLKEAFVKRVLAHNETKEKIDRETFADLVEAGTGGGVPTDLYRAPEYKAAAAAYRGNKWPEGEERVITFTHLDKFALEKVSAAIDNMFADPAARSVLENFLPKF